ncbi:MAG: hypothetical protein ACI4BC_05935, partial [Muribaculaceae bacterium]
KAHKTWQVQQDAYIKLLDKVENRIEVIQLETDYQVLLGFKTTSNEFKDYMTKVKAALDAGDTQSAKSLLASAKLKKKDIEVKRKKKVHEVNVEENTARETSPGSLYAGGSPFTPEEIAKIQEYENRILESIVDDGFVPASLNKEYHDYILNLSNKYYTKQVSQYSPTEQAAMKKTADRYLARPSINPHGVLGTSVGGVYKGKYDKCSKYLKKLKKLHDFGITEDELSIVQRFTSESTFSNAYNLRHSSPYWTKKWKDMMAMLTPDEAKEMEQIIEEWCIGANYTLDRMVRYNGITFRGISSGGGAELRAQLTKAFNSGTAWINEASCSTSMKFKVAEDFDGDLIMVIHNKTGAYVHEISIYATEYEITTLRGAKYRVIKPPTFIDGRYIVEIEEI